MGIDTRTHEPGATYFFKVNLAERHGNDLLTRHIDALREAFRVTQRAHPFAIEARLVNDESLLGLHPSLRATHTCGAFARPP